MFGGDVIQVLLIEDEEYDVQRVMSTLKPFHDRITVRDVVSNGYNAIELIQSKPDAYDIVIMDFQIAGGLMGEQLIREIKRIEPSVQIIVITKMTINITDFEFASGLISAGAFWYCTKYPGDIESYIYQPTDFILSIFNAYQKRQLEKDRFKSNKTLARTIEGILKQKQILGVSRPIQEVLRQITKCAESNASVLITGSSGTGKELVAHNIHYLSQRKFENFIPINCGGIPDELVESELFGYAKGAFTGASTSKLGLFEVANHGSVFLDEVSELPQAAQVKLLRVLQDGEIEKIGRTDKSKVDVRVIAATNKNLEQEVTAKRFREDLFYRLNVVIITIPPLRERKDDIPVYIDHFLQSFCRDVNREVPSIDDEARGLLLDYEWPGNVRELKNVLQRLLFESEQVITRQRVEIALGRTPKVEMGDRDLVVHYTADGGILPWRQMERVVREKYFRYVRTHSSSNAEAAKKLGLAPPNYHRMCKELGIR
jgi:two-component system response regulator AtoC